MKITEVRSFKCELACPNCGETITCDINEVMCGGGYCMDCGNDFEIDEHIGDDS